MYFEFCTIKAQQSNRHVCFTNNDIKQNLPVEAKPDIYKI